MTSSADVDRGALLSALVLAPTTFARNRFFSLFNEPSAKRTRSRAAQLRTIVRQLSHDTLRAEFLELAPGEGGSLVLRYGIHRLRLERTAVLERLELALIRFAVARRIRTGTEPLAPPLQVTSEDRALVYASIAKLGDKLLLPLGLDENGATVASEEYHRATTPGDS
jgi:hypothetical protein